ncbi:MAG: nucleoside triphosphate pyrophosphohydrolase [Clostridiales bacterium]|nr:nucleoside triphosphate pyrophosphohydrolase [Clostridiales bacterium]
MADQYDFNSLKEIVRTLRSPEGCPWDRAQTHESMRSCTVEEAYEVNQAVNDLSKTGDSSNLCEELGDLLLQVMLHCQIAEENGEFTLEDVIDGIAQKMIRRHPHVFGEKHYESVEEQKKDWEQIKTKEKAQPLSPQEEIAAIPPAFPALIRSQKVLKKAIKYEMISSDDEKIFHDMMDSLVELQKSGNRQERREVMSEKMGVLLFAISQFAAKEGINSEQALTNETDKFIETL